MNQPTSACAESTHTPAPTRPGPASHLRLRGEHSRAYSPIHSVNGPPPLVRRAPGRAGAGLRGRTASRRH